MNGQIILVGYDKDAEDKMLRIEATYEKDGTDIIDVVSFPDLDISIERCLLLEAIDFLYVH